MKIPDNNRNLIVRPEIKTTFIMLIGLFTGLTLITFNVIGYDFDFFPGDLGDGRLVLYYLEHAHKFFTGQLKSFWNAPFMYPESNVISYSENMIGSAPIFVFFRLTGFDIYKSFQLWFVAVSALNYVCAFYFLKHVFRNNYSAVLGAFIFAFSIALQSQLTHAQTFPRFAIPLAFLMAVKFSEALKPKYFFFTLLLTVYQFYCGIYLGFMLAFPIGIFVLLIIVNHLWMGKQRFFNVKWLLHIILFSLLSVVILLPLILPYMERKIPASIEHYKIIMGSIPTIRSHLFCQEGSLIWDFLSKSGHHFNAWWDHQIFAGGIATVSLILGFFLLIFYAAKKKILTDAYSIPFILIFTGLITFIFFIRFGETSAYLSLYFLPGFNSMRSITRIINIELIFFGISTAFVISFIMKRYFRYRSLIFIGTLTMLVCDNYFYKERTYKTEVSIAKERTNNIEKVFAEIPAGSVVSYEPSQIETASIYYHIDAMLTAQKHDLKTLNGYTGTSPVGYDKYWVEPNAKFRNFWLSHEKIVFDTLYVVKTSAMIKKVPAADIQLFNVKARLEDMISYIKTDKEWMKLIEQKAIKNNISIDSMIVLDAKWVIENEK